MTAASAPSLRELQRWFASVTTHPQGVLEGHPNPRRSQKLERLVTPGPQLSAIDRVQIYLVSGVPLTAAVATLESRSQAAGTSAELAHLLPQWLGSWVQSGFFRGIELA